VSSANPSVPPRLLPQVGTRAPWLSLALIAVSFLGALDILGTTLALRSLWAWPDRLAGSVTVMTAGHGLEGADASAARTVELLAHTPGVSKAWLVDPDPADALAARIMGVEGAGPDTTQPRLVGVIFEDGSPISAYRLVALLRRARINAAVDDHGGWSGPLERAALLASIGAAAIFLASLAALFGLTALGVGRSLTRLRGRVTLLIHFGASESEITGPFSRRLALTAIIGAVLGAAAAAGFAAVLAGSWWVAPSLKALGASAPPLDVWTYLSAFSWCLAAWPMGVLAAVLTSGSRVRHLS
jgi:cell division protein FtsX